MDMKDLEDVAHRYKKATDALDVVRTEMQGTAVALLQQDGVKQADVARVTGWSREHLRRLKEKAEMEALRRKVEELSTHPGPPARPTAATAPEPRKPRPRPKPAPKEGRPLLEDEAATLAETARTRATESQRQKLQQLVANTANGYEDYAVVSSALDMGLLTHDEVYAEPERPVGSEETTR